MPKKFINEVLATISNSKIKSIVILDIENSQQFIPELFIRAPEALYIVSASRTQTYSLKKISSLAETMEIDLCSDLFSGQQPDKADKRLIAACEAICETFAGIEISAYTKDKIFAEELKSVCMGVRIRDVNSSYRLADDELLRLKNIRNPLIRRYIKRRGRYLKGR